MKFTRLRLSGFKSFVEPTDLLIEPGLTGVVGPNGCGKSNLLEALRWVMGESSYKSMRASGMEDVIFSGTSERPSRNMAEVMVTMKNDARTAPAQYNDSDVLEISRRIEREAGSAYRINGREVRARDVQLLFADVSTGARSPALVRQGQIAEIINSKPQARRLILEEAAGITGLHTRRHDAELKLKGAEQNLTRLEDVAAQLESQLNSLKRQARQAQRYKQISAEIRKFEAAGLYVAWRDAAEASRHDSELLDQATRVLAEATRLSSERLRLRDELGDKLPSLREQETVRAAVLQRMNAERNALDEEERRAEERRKELAQRIAQIESDLAREQDAIADTANVREQLAAEQGSIREVQSGSGEIRAAAAAALQAAADLLSRTQEEADAASSNLSDLTARRGAGERSLGEYRQRIEKLEREARDIEARRQAIVADMGGMENGEALSAALADAMASAAAGETAAHAAETQLRISRQIESDARQTHDDTRRAMERLQTEVRTLKNLLVPASGSDFPSLADLLDVEPGYEAALVTALGEDIDAAADERAPAHWRGLPQYDAVAPLPGGAMALSSVVDAPPALLRRLAHVGVVDRAIGHALQNVLQPGQRLVSREGDIWRWDGFTAAADAPSASAKRFMEKNRLVALEAELQSISETAANARNAFEMASADVEKNARAEREAREHGRTAAVAVELARKAFSAHERKAAELAQRTSALGEAERRIGESRAETAGLLSAGEAEFAALPEAGGLQSDVERLRASMLDARNGYADARATHDGIEREVEARAARLRAIDGELAQWSERAKRAENQIGSLNARAEETRAEIESLSGIPQAIADRRFTLMNLLQEAEATRRDAADALAVAENAVRAADHDLRAVQEEASSAREEHARLEARLEASTQRQLHCEEKIAEHLQCAPAEILERIELEEDRLPIASEIERKLFGLREDRERLGGVNLRAEEESEEVAKQLDAMVKERDDLVQAIAKLRGGIASLNKEGRQRLLDAFGTVNEKFGELFTTLFGGGRAELQLIESDDPLEAGLEIVANPPGKKPTVLSLLSGGEQTLTALSLIFAVFLTNPSPICVLDEVDAPLDDHNVERFCNLLDAMLQRTETRFLIITHHALTMARMHRLYGVTMMERGVSQLVSVNLQQAEALREAS
ncbi:MAG: chromosome segregation protein SMC [Aestuariivirga sp.]